MVPLLTTPDSIGKAAFNAALKMVRTTRAKSVNWRLGAVASFDTVSARQSQTVFEAVQLAEAQLVQMLDSIVESLLFNHASDICSLLIENREEVAEPSAPPPPVVPPAAAAQPIVLCKENLDYLAGMLKDHFAIPLN